MAGKKPDARAFAKDLMRGEHVVGQHNGTLHQAETGREWSDEFSGGDALAGAGTSIFDPVLCELMYRWFSPVGGAVLDPFAGGSVRGIVAAALGRAYTGIDLSARQVAANEAQWAALGAGLDGFGVTAPVPPRWIVGDSTQVATLAAGEYDFVFSCPPYADLECYSEDPRDLSTMQWPEFLTAYRAIITGAVGMLKPDRFACFVVGEVRDPKGFYRGLVPETIRAFEDAGARYYNEAILVTSVGSLPVRVGRQFAAGRKLGKTHQNVLMFVKGNPKKAAKACGEVSGVAMPPEDDDLAH